MARPLFQITAAFIGLALLSACAAPTLAPAGARPGKLEITSRFVITAGWRAFAAALLEARWAAQSD